MKANKIAMLVIAVLAIWGFIGYKIYDSLTNDERGETIRSSTILQKTAVEKMPTYLLKLDYKDPFLSNLVVKAPAVNTGTRAIAAIKTPPPVIPKTPVAWDPISYLGFFNSANHQVTVVRIKDEEFYIQLNEEIGQYRFEKIWKDSILVAVGSESKVFYKNQNKPK